MAHLKLQNLLMKIISKMPKSKQVDREMNRANLTIINSMAQLRASTANPDSLTVEGHDEQLDLLTYHRYTTELSKERFQELNLPNIDPAKVAPMDCVDQIENLSAIGKAVAEEQVDLKDFDGFLDP